MRSLLATVDADPSRRWTDEDVLARGLEPARLRRWFKQHFGMTFHAYLRSRRLGLALGSLQQPASHTIVGQLAGTRPALESALEQADVFGRAVLISAEWPPGVDREILDLAARIPDGQRPKITVLWSRTGQAGSAEDDGAKRNRQLLEALGGLGYEATDGLSRDAPGPSAETHSGNSARVHPPQSRHVCQ